jgi:hypothetical protein
MNYVIYGLVDPRDEMVRYVGFTAQSLQVRLTEHLSESRRGAAGKGAWIRELVSAGLQPRIAQLELTARNTWQERERWWISHFGDRLTNLTAGGDGTLGYRYTPEELEAMRIRQTGTKHTPEALALMIARRKGTKASETTKEKMRKRRLGTKATPEVLERMRAGQLAAWARKKASLVALPPSSMPANHR